jgi:hypothetical protein
MSFHSDDAQGHLKDLAKFAGEFALIGVKAFFLFGAAIATVAVLGAMIVQVVPH